MTRSSRAWKKKRKMNQVALILHSRGGGGLSSERKPISPAALRKFSWFPRFPSPSLTLGIMHLLSIDSELSYDKSIDYYDICTVEDTSLLISSTIVHL